MPIVRDLDRQPRSLGRDAVRRFAKNKLAIVGMVIVMLLTIIAVFADDWFIALPLGRAPQPLIARTPYNKGFYGPTGAFPSSRILDGDGSQRPRSCTAGSFSGRASRSASASWPRSSPWGSASRWAALPAGGAAGPTSW